MTGISNKKAMHSSVPTSQAVEETNKKRRRKRGGKKRNRSKPYSHKNAEQRFVIFIYFIKTPLTLSNFFQILNVFIVSQLINFVKLTSLCNNKMSKRLSKTATRNQAIEMMATDVPSYIPTVSTSQNTRNVSVCDRYQKNRDLNQSHFSANNQPRSSFISSNYHQSNSSIANISSPQHKKSLEEDIFNIKNLPNIQLQTKGLFCF